MVTRVFLLAGQSNMLGVARNEDVPDARRAVPANVVLFEDDDWRPLLWRPTFGPELVLAQRLGEHYADGRVALCKVAASGLSLYRDWSPRPARRGPKDHGHGRWFRRLCGALATVRERLAGDGASVTVPALFWMQGERDSDDPVMADSYGAGLQRLVDGLRMQSDNPSLALILGTIPGTPRPLPGGLFKFSHGAKVVAAQRALCAADPHCVAVETADLSTVDGFHFDAAAQLALGERFATAWLRTGDPRRTP